jgi:hypothetical protein
MSAIDLRLDSRAFDAELRDFRARLARANAQAVPRAEARALNRAAAHAATRTRRELATVKRLPQKLLKRRISSYQASPQRLTARVWVGTKRKIPLSDIPGAHTALAGKRAGQVRAGRLAVQTFKATMPSGKTGRFVRVEPGQRRTAGRPATSSPNLPIEEPAIRLQPEAGPILERAADTALRTVYVTELRRLLARALKI